jgi:Zn-dependent protease with chaperone function
LSSGREAVVAAFSRAHETEADELGCKLAAMSCYDTRRGIEVYRKMQEATANDGNALKQNFMSSHPPSQDRYHNLQSLVETQNFLEYSYCNTLKKRIARALKSKDL